MLKKTLFNFIAFINCPISMQRHDFTYSLPNELIAREPAEQMRDSRLLCLDGASGVLAHRQFPDVLELVRHRDLMVVNDTRVIPARLFGRKDTGCQVEILVERVLVEQRVLAHTRASKSPKVGRQIVLQDGTGVTEIGRAARRA